MFVFKDRVFIKLSFHCSQKLTYCQSLGMVKHTKQSESSVSNKWLSKFGGDKIMFQHSISRTRSFKEGKERKEDERGGKIEERRTCDSSSLNIIVLGCKQSEILETIGTCNSKQSNSSDKDREEKACQQACSGRFYCLCWKSTKLVSMKPLTCS